VFRNDHVESDPFRAPFSGKSVVMKFVMRSILVDINPAKSLLWKGLVGAEGIEPSTC
jgi:hypothetical protein